MGSLRIVHYLNQFFGGIGGEAVADTPVQVRDGSVGPGRMLQQALGEAGAVVATLIAGDNHMAVQIEPATARVREALSALRPDVVVAGPAFDSERYGLACAQVCLTAQALGIPAITAMCPENPGYTTHRRHLICLPTGQAVVEMVPALDRLPRLALKLGAGQELVSAEVDGYLPRGLRKVVRREKPGAERAVDMLVAWLNDRPFTTEIPVLTYDAVPAAPPVADLAATRLAVVTSGGLVPSGNPDRLVSARAERVFRYSIDGLASLRVGDWQTVHGGYSNAAVNERNPNFVVPLDVLREFEAAGRFRALYPVFFATVGNQTAVADARRMGAEIAAELRVAQVDAVLLVSS